ncbi:MAG: DEAD/DEAH box helicase [Lentisphaerae bacterium]|nr:DEAD/DEAH box helicase [Lentisphaerota bacterium]
MVKKLIQKLLWRRKTSREASFTHSDHASAKTTQQGNPISHEKRQSRVHASNGHNWSISDFIVEPREDAKRFHDFDLPEPIMHAIYDLGFKYCTPIQEKVLMHVREGQNVAGKAQTGTGKTAAFLICIFARFIANQSRTPDKKGAPRALVLAPTRELVIQITKDAKDLSKYCPINCAAVYGGMDFERQQNEISHSRIDLVAATPGRLIDFMHRGILNMKHVEALVIDEADRMLDMGFIPDVSRIIRAVPPKDKRRTMLFSATLTSNVLRLASQWMPDPIICEIEPEKVTVDATKQIVYVVKTTEKFALLFNLLAEKHMKRVLIFGNRRDTTKRLADNLARHGVPCELLSGTVRQEKRLKILEDFKKGKTRVVVATDVAGRGLHVANISHVINYDFPYEPEDYVHRIGRTGRAGLSGIAISFACEEESFVIPDIEKYIGQTLACTIPDDKLLTPPPRTSITVAAGSNSRSSRYTRKSRDDRYRGRR